MTKEKIVKKKYDASEGVIYEQDFENVTDSYELTYENWSFETGGSLIETKRVFNGQDKFLKINDAIESDVYADRKSFGRIYGDFEIECSLMFDRNGKYVPKGDDMSYSLFRINSGILSPIRLNAIDNGGDTLTLQVQHMIFGSSTYVSFATVDRGEWFDVKIKGGYGKDGKLKFKLYFNGKHIPVVDNMLYDNGVGYIDGFEMVSSGVRKSVIGIDNVRITSLGGNENEV